MDSLKTDTVGAVRSILRLTLLLGLIPLASLVWAQGVFDRPLRIGFVLPATAAGYEAEDGRPRNAAQAALLGARFAREELLHNASLLGIEVDVLIATAEDSQVSSEATRLVEEEGAFALAGGFGPEQAAILSEFAAQNEIPFLNIGTASDRLRNEGCNRFTYHVEPSDAMYLDALVGWFVRAGFRRWSIVTSEGERGEELQRRAEWALTERHFGGRVVNRVSAPDQGADWDRLLGSVRRGNPDVVLLLLSPDGQLEFIRSASDAGDAWEIAGMPYPDAQTRHFYELWSEAAAGDETLYRASTWEATLDAYGAREFNERFAARWGTPMDASAWAAYQAVRILYDSAMATRSLSGPEIAGYMSNPEVAVFDVWKGIGVSFRPWDHQLRQSLYLVQLTPNSDRSETVTLVGELPALYLPRTDPVERLDQLGDLGAQSECRF